MVFAELWMAKLHGMLHGLVWGTAYMYAGMASQVSTCVYVV